MAQHQARPTLNRANDARKRPVSKEKIALRVIARTNHSTNTHGKMRSPVDPLIMTVHCQRELLNYSAAPRKTVKLWGKKRA